MAITEEGWLSVPNLDHLVVSHIETIFMQMIILQFDQSQFELMKPKFTALSLYFVPLVMTP